jgi:hypothetical protein
MERRVLQMHSFVVFITRLAGRSFIAGANAAGAGNFSVHRRVQNGSGAHLLSYPVGTRGSFPGGKAVGA